MAAPFSTLLLDLGTWDLVLDSGGHIARADAPYAVAQNVANAIKTFLGDAYFDQAAGVPYLQQFLGQMPPLSVLRAALVNAALTVPSVVSATCVITSLQGRALQGQVQFKTSTGQSGSVSL